MNIVYAVHGYKPAYRIGGPILSVAAAAERLVRRGHKITVLTSNSNLDEDLDVPLGVPVTVDGVTVYYFKRQEPLQRLFPFLPYVSQSMGFLYVPDIKQHLERLAPETHVIHTQMPFVYPTYAAGRAAIRHGIPLFYHQRGVFDPERLRYRGLKKRLYISAIEVPLLRGATTLIALTEAEVRSYRALGVQTPCRVIPNGIDTALYEHGDAAAARAKWKIPASSTVILFLGRIHPIKGADALLEGFLSLAPSRPDLFLVLAGPDEYRLQEKFEATAQRAGLRDQVVFTGMVTGQDKLDLLAAADVFSLPSAAEGFSMAVLESLASSTAVLLSPGCYFPEVESAKCGLVVGTQPHEIAGGIATITKDRAALAEMGRVARRFVQKSYEWETIVDQLVDAYEEGIGRKRGAMAVPR